MKSIIAILLCCILLTACGSPDASTGATPTDNETSLPAESETAAETTQAQTVLLTVFAPDENVESFVMKEVEVDAVSEAVIIQQLILAGVLPEGIEVHSMYIVADENIPENTQLQVDFNGAFRELILSQGSAGERAIMGSVVNTFLTAYDAQNMMISVDGEILESGHIIYDIPLGFYE